MGIIAVVANLLFFGLLLLVEALIAKLGWIPQREPHHDPKSPLESFLYFRDRDLFRIGDTVGLSITAFAVGSILDQVGFPTDWYSLVAITVAIVVTGIMHQAWLRQYKRDSAYPPGGVSLLGIFHLPYFAGHLAWILLGLRHITDPNILGLIFLGGGIWGIAFWNDLRQKK